MNNSISGNQDKEYISKIKKLEQKIKELEFSIKEKDIIINEEKIKNENLNKRIRKYIK